jgi:hypothetical protein
MVWGGFSWGVSEDRIPCQDFTLEIGCEAGSSRGLNNAVGLFLLLLQVLLLLIYLVIICICMMSSRQTDFMVHSLLELRKTVHSKVHVLGERA